MTAPPGPVRSPRLHADLRGLRRRRLEHHVERHDLVLRAERPDAEAVPHAVDHRGPMPGAAKLVLRHLVAAFVGPHRADGRRARGPAGVGGARVTGVAEGSVAARGAVGADGSVQGRVVAGDHAVDPVAAARSSVGRLWARARIATTAARGARHRDKHRCAERRERHGPCAKSRDHAEGSSDGDAAQEIVSHVPRSVAAPPAERPRS